MSRFVIFILRIDDVFQEYTLNINELIVNNVINHYIGLGMIFNIKISNLMYILKNADAPENINFRIFSSDLQIIDEFDKVIGIISRFI